MGDRGNIVVEERNGGEIWIYSHGGGHGLPRDLKNALMLGERWTDEQYLTRIIFQRVVKNTGTTGYGLSTCQRPRHPCNPTLRVRMKDQTVICQERSVSFADYVAMSDDAIMEFGGRE